MKEQDCAVDIDSEKEIQTIPQLTQPLLNWFWSRRRELPWRVERKTAAKNAKVNPYTVWLSEIMLQQTRAVAVIPYYERFIKELPDVKALANAPEDLLLKLWEGLGYYSRVRNLQKAARQIVDVYDGHMPENKKELQKLSGIGAYTAGAIASIAFEECVPAVDGNVLRVLSRLRMDARDISVQKTKNAIEEELTVFMETERREGHLEHPGDFNQALMDLGAEVCVPNGMPKCDLCPLSEICKAHGAAVSGKDRQETDYPVKRPAKARRVEYKTVLVLRDRTHVMIRKRPKEGLLAGLYELPWLEGTKSAQEVLANLNRSGVHVLQIEELPSSKHIFSHIEWYMRGFLVWLDELEKLPCAEGELFVSPMETRKEYAIPSAFKAYKEALFAEYP